MGSGTNHVWEQGKQAWEAAAEIPSLRAPDVQEFSSPPTRYEVKQSMPYRSGCIQNFLPAPSLCSCPLLPPGLETREERKIN